jgi:hypothetical protein
MVLSGILLGLTLAHPVPETPAGGGMCVVTDSCERETPEQPPDQTSPSSPGEPVTPGEDVRLDWRGVAFFETGAPHPEHRHPIERPPRP